MRRTLALPLLAAIAIASLPARAADQVRSVAPFTTVANSGAISVHIEVGKAQSVTASGDERFLQSLQTEVVDGQLRLSMRGHDHSNDWGDPKVTITMPALSAFDMAGAGETTISHMRGDKLEIHFAGAGSIRADGSVGKLRLEVSGVGSLDTSQLHADAAEVQVSGVGSVKVFAAGRLDAEVAGVGSIVYYGDPKVVNTRSGGIGSVSHGR